MKGRKSTSAFMLRSLSLSCVPEACSMPQESKSESLPIPKISVDEIQYGSLLAVGTTAFIYDAKWHDKAVVIKKALEDKKSLDTVRHEREILFFLDHPNIVKLYGVVDCPGYDLVLESIAQDMFHVLFEEQSSIDGFRFALEMGNAIDYLSSFNVVHGDIKPENILFTEKHSAKICDFGMAKSAGAQKFFSGTPAYIAPEVIIKTIYSEKSEMYSLGVVLWEMTTRQQYGINLEENELIEQVARCGFQEPIPEYCDPRMADLMQGCLQFEPENRPAAAEIPEILSDPDVSGDKEDSVFFNSLTANRR